MFPHIRKYNFDYSHRLFLEKPRRALVRPVF